MAITEDKSQTRRSAQNMFNNSYDEDFNVIAMELLGYDSDAGVLRRVKVDANGKLKVAV